MDIITLISIILGFASLLIAFVLEGGALSALLQPTAALIVFGGTFGAIGISFSGSSLSKVPKLIGRIFIKKKENRDEILEMFTDLSIRARRDGFLALEQELNNNERDDLTRTGLRLIIDGAEEEVLRNVLETRIREFEEQNEKGSAIFEAAGGFAPTMGVIGTVMGLVHVLGDLSNPGELGAKIAVAFIATLYGVGSANLLWLPIANKLKEINQEESKTKYMILDGMILLRNGCNQTFMREQLKGYLENAKENQTQERE